MKASQCDNPARMIRHRATRTANRFSRDGASLPTCHADVTGGPEANRSDAPDPSSRMHLAGRMLCPHL